MFPDFLGPPQLTALLLVIQRGVEEFYSAYNERRLRKGGGTEKGRTFYPVVATTHLGWIAGIALLIPPDAPVFVPLIGLYLLLQVVRYWVIGTLGRFWTHRIITLPSALLVTRGPYRFVRHPNYVVTLAETFLLPVAFGAVGFALIITAIWASVLRYKIVLEDAALDERRSRTASATDR